VNNKNKVSLVTGIGMRCLLVHATEMYMLWDEWGVGVGLLSTVGEPTCLLIFIIRQEMTSGAQAPPNSFLPVSKNNRLESHTTQSVRWGLFFHPIAFGSMNMSLFSYFPTLDREDR
jgi:hypothetical protein